MTDERVKPLELFFDLVFVFAFTQVTSMLASDPTWGGLLRGLMVLAALWWAWTGYAWMTNALDVDSAVVRLALLAAMAAMLVAALAAPHAFGADGLAFGCAYFVVRAIQVGIYIRETRGDDEVHRAIVRLAPTLVLGPSLIVAASAFNGAAQGGIWAAALAIDYGGPLISGTGGFRVSASHFAERHGLIVIIALGESVAALGVGARHLPVHAGLIAAAVLGVVVSAALWWTYFDVVAIVAERKLTEAEGAVRSALARDSFSYLHMPMVAGIVLFALGAKETLLHLSSPLDTIPAVALCGGISLYLLAHVAFRLRNVGSLARRRLVVAAICAALIPLALHVAALAALAAVASATTGLIVYEVVRFREARSRLHATT